MADGNSLLFKLRRLKDVCNEFPAALYRRSFQFLPITRFAYVLAYEFHSLDICARAVPICSK